MQAPRIVTQPALRLVGAQILTRPMSPEIPSLWPRFAARIPEIVSPAEPGVTWGAMQDVGDNLLYLAAVAVAPQTGAPLDMATLDVPAGDVAVFEFPFGEIGAAYGFIFGRWLPGSTWVQDARPLLERYGTDFCPDQPGSPMQVRVPVRPRA
jgi:predicted transcriptional regulator YdeE